MKIQRDRYCKLRKRCYSSEFQSCRTRILLERFRRQPWRPSPCSHSSPYVGVVFYGGACYYLVGRLPYSSTAATGGAIAASNSAVHARLVAGAPVLTVERKPGDGGSSPRVCHFEGSGSAAYLIPL